MKRGRPAPSGRAAPGQSGGPGSLGAAKPEPLPAAVVIGADPGTILAAVTPVPDTLSEYQFAGLLRGERVETKRIPAELILRASTSAPKSAANPPVR